MQVTQKIHHCKMSFYRFMSPDMMTLYCLLMQQQQAHLEEVKWGFHMQQDSVAIEGKTTCEQDTDTFLLL